jgi:membrane-bound serine protease (ClpP class)
MFMRTPHAVAVWLVVAMIPSLVSAQTRPTSRPAVAVKAAVVALHGQINEFNQNAFIRHFNQAKTAGATVIIVDIDTNGGLVTAALDISHFLKRQDDVHTIAYIDNKAYSAGSLISLACNEIVMAPSASLGDCAPIVVDDTGQLRPLPDTERSKAESPILADFQDSAIRNGYSVPLAMSMVTIKPIYFVEARTGSGVERQYVAMSSENYENGVKQGLWKPVPDSPEPVLIPGSLLTVSGTRAREMGMARQLEPSTEALAMARNYDIVGVYETSLGEQVIGMLNSWVARMLLLGIFLTSLYMVMHAPGHGFAEVLAVVSLAVLVGVPLLTGYAQWWEIILVMLGIGLLAMELFVIPGFGVAGFAGIAMILLGFLLTFIAPEPGHSSPLRMPSLPTTWKSLQTGLLAVVGGMACALLLSAWLRRFLPKIPYFNRLILNTTVGGTEAAMAGSMTNIEPTVTLLAVGAVGRAVADLRPGGTAEFLDSAGAVHIVSVISDSGFVAAGTGVVVREVHGNRIVVRAAK